MEVHVTIDEGKPSGLFLLSQESLELSDEGLVELELLNVEVSEARVAQLLVSTPVANVAEIHSFIVTAGASASLLHGVGSSSVTEDHVGLAGLGGGIVSHELLGEALDVPLLVSTSCFPEVDK